MGLKAETTKYGGFTWRMDFLSTNFGGGNLGKKTLTINLAEYEEENTEKNTDDYDEDDVEMNFHIYGGFICFTFIMM